jgi:hypothetical protein
VKLFEHRDFEQSILRAAEHFRARGLRPAIIEKDYYVTEALRIVASARDKVIFKGGTSLAKGWNLIQRFSEDIDVFLDPQAFRPVLANRAIDRELKTLRNAVGAHPALTFLPGESQTIGGFGRNDRFSYTQLFGGPGEVANRVLVEAGSASGREPTVTVELRSYLGQFPRYPVSEGETMDSFLRARTMEGALGRYGLNHKKAYRQIERELAMIEKLKLSGYFLIVWDVVRFCRENGILVQGRGSAANSAVCYSLGITAVDAVEMDLLFERFLSEERGEWPDIDLDLPSGDDRERAIQYVYQRYGKLRLPVSS